MGRDAGSATLNFSLFNCQIDLGPSGIASHVVNFEAECFFQHVGHDRREVGRSRCPALGKLGGCENIFQGFPRRVRFHIKQQIPLIDAAEPNQLPHIERRFFSP